MTATSVVLECEHEHDDGHPILFETPFAEADIHGSGPGGVIRWFCGAGDEHECGIGEL